MQKHTRANLILFAGSLITATILAEIVLRFLLPAPITWRFPQEEYRFDAEIGHWLESNQTSFTHDKEVTTNSQGLRDSEYDKLPPPGIRRILALGDSQTFGNGLAQADTWPAQLERKLGDGYQVLNGGLPASDTWQHEIILRRLMDIYHPDAVILAFYINDVVTKPNTIRFSQRSDRNSPSARLIYILKQSALLMSARAAFEALRQSISPSEGFILQNKLVRGESNPEIDRRWAQVEQSLMDMRRITEERGVEFVVVSLPRRDQVDGRMPAEQYNQRLESVVTETGTRFINMLDPLRSAYTKYGRQLFIPWDGHNSKIANEVIAREIAAFINQSAKPAT